jgi:hypothetical protein
MVVLGVFALPLSGCGCGSSTETAAAPQGVIQASFGSPSATAAQTSAGLAGDETWDVRIFNFSDALILDMGLRELGSSDAWVGGLAGHDPATFGEGTNGGSYWLTVPRGAYEVFVETDQGMLTVSGFTPTTTLSDGRSVPGPAEVYVWGSELQGPVAALP